MGRTLRGAALLAGVALLLAGCGGRPPGVDGNLTNNWSTMPDATIPVPADHACYDVHTDDPANVTKLPAPVDCTATHTFETIHVGTFTGTDAAADVPPPVGGPARRKAYEECASSAKTFLGDDWRTGRLDVVVVTPIALHWEAGARWFRCDAVEYSDFDNYEIASRTASLRGALTGDRTLGLGCFSVAEKNSAIDTMTPTNCAASHDAEFAGVFDAPDADYIEDDNARHTMHSNGCKAVVAAFAGVPNDGNLQYRTGFISGPFNKQDWQQGNRGVRCYIWPGKPVAKSLKGAGVAGLPINYG